MKRIGEGKRRDRSLSSERGGSKEWKSKYSKKKSNFDVKPEPGSELPPGVGISSALSGGALALGMTPYGASAAVSSIMISILCY